MSDRLVMEVDDNRRRRLAGGLQGFGVQQLDAGEAWASWSSALELGSQEIAGPSRGDLRMDNPGERAKQVVSPEVPSPAQPIPFGQDDPACAHRPFLGPAGSRPPGCSAG